MHVHLANGEKLHSLRQFYGLVSYGKWHAWVSYKVIDLVVDAVFCLLWLVATNPCFDLD